MTFGRTASTGSNDSSDNNYINGSTATLATPGTLASLSVYIGTTPAGAHVRLALYTNNGSGNPGTLIGQTAELTAVVGWVTIPVSSSIALTPGTYWVVAQADNIGTVYRYSAGLSATDFWGWTPQTSGTFPATISSWFKQSGVSFSMYGTISIASSPTNTPTATPTNTSVPLTATPPACSSAPIAWSP